MFIPRAAWRDGTARTSTTAPAGPAALHGRASRHAGRRA